MDIKILIFDIDGTLVDRSKQTVEDDAIQAMKQAKDKGYQILIATGRSFFFIHDDVRERVPSDYYVTVNGALLNDGKGEVIKSYGYSHESLNNLIDFAEDHEFPIGIKYHDFIGIHGDYQDYVTRYVGFKHPGVKFLLPDNERKYLSDNNPVGAFCFGPNDMISVFQEKMPELYFTRASDIAFEVTKQGVDKTKAIEDVLNMNGLSWDNVMAFGDGDNDIEMLEKAKVAVVMGNATDNVKEYADYITDTVLNSGIIKAMRALDIIE